MLLQLPYSFHLFSYICKLFHHTNVKQMDQTLLKYWKTCLQDAERKAIALKGPRITLNIDDKILKFIPLKSIPVIFPDWKAEDSNEKQK